MRRVDADFERLQPVAVPIALEGERVGVGRDEAIEVRECRRLARAEIGEQHAAALEHRVGDGLDVLAHPAAFRFGGRLDALAARVELPAVERAAQPVGLDASVGEIRAAVRAVSLDQRKILFSAIQDQILAEQPNRLHGTFVT